MKKIFALLLAVLLIATVAPAQTNIKADTVTARQVKVTGTPTNSTDADTVGARNAALANKQDVDPNCKPDGNGTLNCSKVAVGTTVVFGIKGAKGDGIADDSAAVQAAHDALPASGGLIIATAGRYRLAHSVTITKPIIMHGVGQGVTVFDIQHSGTGFQVTGHWAEQTTVFRDLTIESTRATYAPTAVNITLGVGFPLFDNVHFKNIKGPAIQITDGRRLHVTNSWFEHCGSTSAAKGCIHLDSGTTATTGTDISGNVFEPWDYAAISSTGGIEAAKIRDNWFESVLSPGGGSAATYAVRMVGSGWDSAVTTFSRDAVISNNKIVLYDSTSQYGLWLKYVQSAIIKDNAIANAKNAIYLEGALRCGLFSNSLTLADTAIWLIGALENRIIANEVAGSVTADIADDGSAQKLLVFDNVFRGAIGLNFAAQATSSFRRAVLGPNPLAWEDRGDNDVTLTPGTDSEVQRFATTLTANRTVTLSTTGAIQGDKFRIVRTGLGAFTLDVGGIKTIPSGTAAWVEVQYSKSVGGWVLVGYGTL